ncbi:MAG: DUF3352 domain-containing protein, partial [Actinomycetota bacterium]|nr:DUF3352 domain-containing protein [Actinomycetota bacterium]
MKPKIAIGIVVTLLLVGAIGALSYGFFFASAEDNALGLVPRDSIGYFNAFLSPSNGQKQALQDLIEKTPYETPEEAMDKLRSLFDEGLQDTGCSFAEDIDPWLGKQVAGFLTMPAEGVEAGSEYEGGFLVATDDQDAAVAALEKCGDEDYQNAEDRAYESVDYKFSDETAVGMVEGYLVIGTEPGFKQVVDTAGGADSLEGSETFQDAVEPLADDRLATFYLDVGTLIRQVAEADPAAAAQASIIESFYGGENQTLAGGLFLRSDAIVFEYAAGVPQEGDAAGFVDATTRALESDVLSELPGGSWGALGVGSVGEYIDTSLDTFGQFAPGGRDFIDQQFERATGLSLSEDVLAWMGDLGIFVQGTEPTTLGGGVVIETTDPQASLVAVQALETWARKEKAPVKELTIPGAEGFAVQDPFQPQPINIAVADDRVV